MSQNPQTALPKSPFPTLVLTGGGSGGHITPVLSLARALKKSDPQCRLIYIGLKGEKIEGLENKLRVFDKTYRISSGKFRRYHGESFLAHLVDIKTWLLNFRDFFKVIAGILQSRRLLKRLRPDLVFSKGGYVVVPVGVAAKLQKIPIVTHDSDAAAGLANRILGRWAVVHATGLPAKYYAYPQGSVHFVGIPLDERVKPVTDDQKKRFKSELGFTADSPLLLVGGAGLGARDINNLVLSIAPKLLQKKPELQIVHFTGSRWQKDVGEKYSAALSEDQLQKIKVIGFSYEFYKYSGAADLIISRAGATTIAELAVQRKPAILIPAPFLPGGQQIKNTKQLKGLEAAEVLNNDIEPEKLLKIVDGLLNNTQARNRLAEKLGATARPDAANKLAKLLLNIAKQKDASA